MIRVQLDSPPELSLSAWEIPIIKKLEESQGGMDFAQSRIQFQSFSRGLPGFYWLIQ
jgi:hypothetical protein